MFSIFTLPPSVSLNLNHFPSDNIFLQTGPNAGTIFYFYLFIYLFIYFANRWHKNLTANLLALIYGKLVFDREL
jgi:hypothetical protein